MVSVSNFYPIPILPHLPFFLPPVASFLMDFHARNFRRDGTKDDIGTLSSSQQHLVELAALVLYRVFCSHA